MTSQHLALAVSHIKLLCFHVLYRAFSQHCLLICDFHCHISYAGFNYVIWGPYYDNFDIVFSSTHTYTLEILYIFTYDCVC